MKVISIERMESLFDLFFMISAGIDEIPPEV